MSRLMSRLACLVLVALIAACAPESLPANGPDMLMPGTCGSDSQCGGATPRCDLNARACVPCLPANDNCPKGQRCVPSKGSFTCSSACVVDSDCPRSDAGTATACCSGGCVDIASDTQS